MSSYYVDVDLRHFAGKVRYYVTDKVVQSVNYSDNRLRINESVYDIIRNDIPVRTGALQESPDNSGYVGVDTKGYEHYAEGFIDEEMIMFNPYTISPKRHSINYYGDKVPTFKPYLYISDHDSEIYESVKEILTDDLEERLNG